MIYFPCYNKLMIPDIYLMQKTLPTQLTLDECSSNNLQIRIDQSIGTEQLSQKSKIINKIRAHLPDVEKQFYPSKFARMFLLIKLNSILKPACQLSATNAQLMRNLAQIYNSDSLNDILLSNSEDEIMTQILCKANHLHLNFTQQQFQDICYGNALLTATSIWLLQEAKTYVKKSEIVFSMSFATLGRFNAAFTPIVHLQKNHAGQIKFASRVFEMTELNYSQMSQKEAIKLTKVQDSYSIRCSPQVSGITYDLIDWIQQKLSQQINLPNHKYICRNGKSFPNLLRESDSMALQLDYLLFSLQEIGAISFLRSQRTLNSYLGKNSIQTQRSQQYEYLKVMLNKGIRLASENKVMVQMGNADTMNINNYQSDIFTNVGGYFVKVQKVMNNLYYIMALQAASSLLAIKVLYPSNYNDLFKDKKVQTSLNFIDENIKFEERGQIITQIRYLWQV